MLRRRKGSRQNDEPAEPEVDPADGGDGPDGPADDGDGADAPADADDAVGASGEGRAPAGEEAADVASGSLPRPSVETLSDARLLFDCAAWAKDDRAALDAALGARCIDRIWQGPELVVGLLDEHLVEEAFDDMGVGQAHLSADTDQVVYEVGEWPRVLRDSLAESLLVAGIAAGWDELADLHVAASDEAAVDEILEAMPDPDEVFEEAEGTEVQDLLTQLYAAVDRLKDSPKIPGARLDVVEAADRMDRLAVPFGFDAAQWRDLVERAGDLRDEIDLALPDPEDDLDLDDDLDGLGDEVAGDEAGASNEDLATVGDNAGGGASGAASVAAPFATRAAQLRDRLVRLV